MRIAVTGHRGLPQRVGVEADKAIRDLLSRYDARSLVGVSCLADSSDQIFAQAILDTGGRLEAIVVPGEHRDFPDGEGSAFAQLLARATQVRMVALGLNRAASWTQAGHELLRDMKFHPGTGHRGFMPRVRYLDGTSHGLRTEYGTRVWSVDAGGCSRPGRRTRLAGPAAGSATPGCRSRTCRSRTTTRPGCCRSTTRPDPSRAASCTPST